MLDDALAAVPWWVWPLLLLVLFFAGCSLSVLWDVRKAKVRDDWESSLDTARKAVRQ